MYKAEILLDSINPAGSRLTTMRVTMPRFILAEFNTHRVFSRNAASSRAISIKRRIEQVEQNPVFPLEWGLDQKGMSASNVLDQESAIDAVCEWKDAANYAVQQAKALQRLGLHKQIVNRILEPFTWVTVIVSSTEWENFFHLRISPMAQPEIRRTAELMKEALDASVPVQLKWGEWHVPLARDPWVAAGRLARVSYETEGKSDQEDKDLAHRLANSGHWSPFEHIAQALRTGYNNNFHLTWTQWRALVELE